MKKNTLISLALLNNVSYSNIQIFNRYLCLHTRNTDGGPTTGLGPVCCLGGLCEKYIYTGTHLLCMTNPDPELERVVQGLFTESIEADYIKNKGKNIISR